MTGLDFLTALEKAGVVLPIRIFFEGRHPNIYRPHAISFCDLTVDDDDDLGFDSLIRLGGCDVSIVSDQMTDKIRSMASALLQVRPKHLVVCAGITFASWAPHRGWK